MSSCTATFESSTELESHIAGNLHNIQQNARRTTNDIARLHLTEIIRTISIDTQEQTKNITQNQNVLHVDFSKSVYYKSFASVGWALRVRKHTNPMTDQAKNFIEKLWINSQETRSKLTPQQIQQQIRTKRDANGDKLFQTYDYPTLNQIKYRCRKICQKYDITAKEELIAELLETNIG